MKSHFATTILAFAPLALACSSAPAPPAKSVTDTPASVSAAAKPDVDKTVKHFQNHVKYPASRDEILVACAKTPEFTADEKKWLSDNMPSGTYASADDVVNALTL
jgi:hypothetical protein